MSLAKLSPLWSEQPYLIIISLLSSTVPDPRVYGLLLKYMKKVNISFSDYLQQFSFHCEQEHISGAL